MAVLSGFVRLANTFSVRASVNLSLVEVLASFTISTTTFALKRNHACFDFTHQMDLCHTNLDLSFTHDSIVLSLLKEYAISALDSE